jgi:hypothetical protein
MKPQRALTRAEPTPFRDGATRGAATLEPHGPTRDCRQKTSQRASTPNTRHATGPASFLTRANWEAGSARDEAQLSGQSSPRRLCGVRCSALLDLLTWREFRSGRLEISVSWFIALSRFIVNSGEG